MRADPGWSVDSSRLFSAMDVVPDDLVRLHHKSCLMMRSLCPYNNPWCYTTTAGTVPYSRGKKARMAVSIFHKCSNPYVVIACGMSILRHMQTHVNPYK